MDGLTQGDGAARFDRERCDEFGRRIALHLTAGNFEAARRVVETAAEELLQEETPRRPLELAIAETRLNLRIANALERDHGVIFVGQLVKLRPTLVMTTRNLGLHSVAQIRRELARLGIRWADELAAQLEGLNDDHNDDDQTDEGQGEGRGD